MSMRRTGKRYLRGAVKTTRDLQEFLNENPVVASVGSLLLNAMMQSKYGPTFRKLLSPATGTAARSGDWATGEAAAPAKPAA